MTKEAAHQDACHDSRHDPVGPRDWLLPKKAVESALRRGMEDALRAADPELHAQVPDSCWHEGWWLHCQPAGSGANVVKYLARYVSRTAISDERIVSADDRNVTFRYTDSATQKPGECTLTAEDGARQRGEGAALSAARGESSGCPACRAARRTIHAPVFAARAATGTASCALFRLDASGRETAPDDHRDAARGADRRADRRGQTVVAPALSALPGFRAGLRRQAPALPCSALLPLVTPSHVSSSANLRLRLTGVDGRSLAGVTEFMIQRASDRRHTPPSAVGNQPVESNPFRTTGYFLGGFGRPAPPRQIQSA